MAATQPAIPLKPEDVPEALVCCICFAVPLTPAITPCEHVFCDVCVKAAVKISPSCPLCREECSNKQLSELQKGGFVYRMWSGIPVKCALHEQGCAWTGTMADAEAHSERCQAGERILSPAEVRQLKGNKEQLQDRVAELEKENGEYKKIIQQFQLTMSTQIDEVSELNARFYHLTSNLEERVSELETQHSQLETQHAELETEHEELRTKYSHLKSEHLDLSAHPLLKLPVLFKGVYNYDDSSKVSTLSQLIGRYLDEKPSSVDRNKIFNCVRSQYLAMQRTKREEQPEKLLVDMRMLLTTAAASKWFTENQMNNIHNWLTEQNWD